MLEETGHGEWKEAECDSAERRGREMGGAASQGEAHRQGFPSCVKNTDISGWF